MPVRLLCLLCCAALLAAGDAPPPTVTVVGLRVVRPPQDEPPGAGELHPFNWSPGTALCLALRPGGDGALRLAEDSSSVAVLADDRGSDLGAGLPEGERVNLRQADRTADGSCLLVELVTPRLPDPGATRLRAKGLLAVVLPGGEPEVRRSDGVVLAAGAELALGDLVLLVESVGPSEALEGFTDVIISRPGDRRLAGGLVFLEGEKVLEGVETFTQVGGRRDRIVVHHLFRRLPAELAVQATLQPEGETREIPFDLEVGLGTGAPAVGD